MPTGSLKCRCPDWLYGQRKLRDTADELRQWLADDAPITSAAASNAWAVGAADIGRMLGEASCTRSTSRAAIDGTCTDPASRTAIAELGWRAQTAILTPSPARRSRTLRSPPCQPEFRPAPWRSGPMTHRKGKPFQIRPTGKAKPRQEAGFHRAAAANIAAFQ
jgi:hypothetical protein